MRVRVSSLAAVAIIGLAAAAGCKGKEEATPTDTAGAATAPVTTEAPGDTTHAVRREVQVQLDSARDFFAKKDTASAARLLRGAASFARDESKDVADDVKKALEESAARLDSLADGIGKGTTKKVDDVLARSHYAEVQYHLDRAMHAWGQKAAMRSGEELVMATDHLERSAKDASVKLDAAAMKSVQQARDLGSRLSKGAAVSAQEFSDATSPFQRTVQEYGARFGGGRG